MTSIETNSQRTRQNCGGYALGIYEWVAPYWALRMRQRLTGDSYTGVARDDLIWDMWDEGYSREEIMKAVIEKDAEFLVNHYSLREVPYTDNPKVTLIAYRLCFPTEDEMDDPNLDLDRFDFHFRIRRCGVWYEKCGKTAPRRCADLRDDEWRAAGDDLVYDGPIKYFEVIK